MDTLAVSAEPIQRRLANAALAMHTLTPDDFTDADDRTLFGEIQLALTAREAAGDEGRIEASTQAMRDDVAVSVARQVSELHGRFFPLTR